MFGSLFFRVLLLVFAFFSGFASAQVITATISGTVRDVTGAVAPGASISIRHVDTGTTRTLTTDESGTYRATNLNLGNYEVQASSAGFQTAVRSGIILTVGREAVVNFTLEVGAVTESVEVTGDAPLVGTTSSSVAGLVEEKTILELPLNGRSFVQLATLEPGVVEAPYAFTTIRGGAGAKVSISGTRPEHTSFLLDGTDINDDVNKTPGSIAGVLLGVETIREFSTIRNSYSAEYGRSAGGVINAVTKSGTNQFQGSVFEFLRNSALDARRFTDLGDNPPPFKRNQFGGVLGGPIVRDKTFFFGGYEGLRERLATTITSNVPDENARRGLLPIANRPGELETVGVDAAVRPYLDLYPLPNGRNLLDGRAEFINALSTPTREDFVQVKVDHVFSPSDFVFVRYTLDDASIHSPDNLGVTKGTQLSSRNQYITLEEKRIFSPTMLNVLRLGFTRAYGMQFETLDQPASLSSIPGRPLASIGTSGLTSIGGSVQPEQLFGLQKWELGDNVSVISGNHSITTGFSGKWFQQFGYSRGRVNGVWRFDSLRLFLTRRPASFEGTLPTSNFERSGRQWLFGFFVQDNYKVRPNLTLNLGLRYEFITVPTEKHGRISNLRDPLDPAVSVGDPLFENPSLRNLAPRFGFAWDVFSDGRTSLRGGYGIFHEQILVNLWRDTLLLNPPWFHWGRIQPLPPEQFPRPDLTNLGGVSGLPLAMDFDLGQPSVMQYNLTIEREFPGNTVLSAGYVGSHGIHLGRQVSNTSYPVILPDGRKFIPPGTPRRNPRFGAFRYKLFDTISNFHSLQLSLKRRFSRGFLYEVSYTLSKFIDDQSGTVGGADSANSPAFTMIPDDRSRDRGLSAFDVRNKLSINYSYELPFGPGKAVGNSTTGWAAKFIEGWQLNGIVSIAAGQPVNLLLSIDRAGDGLAAELNQRPDLLPGASNSPVLGGSEHYYDSSAFALPDAGFYGNLGRNTVIGPGRATFDASLFKNTAFGERASLQFRAEAFNLFNRVNLGLPTQQVFIDTSGRPNSAAGRIRSTTTSARQMQFGLKLIF